MATRCAVIGAGIIGASISLRLSQAGADVTVIEAGTPGNGATANSFAWVGASHPGLRKPEAYFRLNALGVHAYRRLETECDLGATVTRHGCLTWSTNPAEQDGVISNVGYLRDMGYNAIVLSPQRAVRDFDTGIRFPEQTAAIAFFPDEGYASGPPFVGRLLGYARAAGALMVTADQAVELECDTSGVVRAVRLRSGSRVPADVVVVAAGRRSAELLAGIGFRLPLVPSDIHPSPAVGLLVISRPLPCPPRRVLIADDIMIRSDGGGRVIIHDYRADELVRADTPATPVPDAARELLRTTVRHLAGADHAEVESVRIGIRSLPADDMPVVGAVPGHDNLYACVTHSGVTLGPLLGELVTDEVLSGSQVELLQSFRPARFSAAATADA
jgi:glycine/D-amino acid oxidase-like deaminating enzyme